MHLPCGSLEWHPKQRTTGFVNPGVVLLLFVAAPWFLANSATAESESFIANLGEVNEAVRYYACGPRCDIYFTREAIVFDLHEPGDVDARLKPRERMRTLRNRSARALEPVTRRGCAVWMRFADVGSEARIEAHEPGETRYNFFLGHDPARWQTEVPAFGELVYHDLWPGIDVRFYLQAGRLAYEVRASADADLSRARFVFDGAEDVQRKGAGSRRVITPVGILEHRRSGRRSRRQHCVGVRRS